MCKRLYSPMMILLVATNAKLKRIPPICGYIMRCQPHVDLINNIKPRSEPLLNTPYINKGFNII